MVPMLQTVLDNQQRGDGMGFKLILSDCPLHLDIKGDGQIKYLDLSSLKIANCTGCFGCWVKTPGQCVIRDDAVMVYPEIARSDSLIYVSRLKYGGYDTVMKTMLERAIPIQQAFIRLVNGETHHIQREVRPKSATVVGYGSNLDEAEKQVFKRLVERNARNMNFESYRVVFTTESRLAETVKNEVAKWEA